MILVDSGVWIDYFNGVANPQTDCLDGLLGLEPVAIGDIVLTEVLQGFGADRAFEQARRALEALHQVEIAGPEVALEAARNCRRLRTRGITIRKTIDTLIATRCIRDGLPLLYTDRDFDPFVTHLGLLSALPVGTGGSLRRIVPSTCRPVMRTIRETPHPANLLGDTA
jgi:predicted nucleic acid-binding protein